VHHLVRSSFPHITLVDVQVKGAWSGWGHGQAEQVFPRGARPGGADGLGHTNEHASQRAAITSTATKIGCAADTLPLAGRQAERDQGKRPGLTTEERQRPKQLERENVELRRANGILKRAAAYFAQAERHRRAK
jgi:transposase